MKSCECVSSSTNMATALTEVTIDDEVAKRSLIYNMVIFVLVAVITYNIDVNQYRLAYDLVFGFLITYFVDIMFVQKTFLKPSASNARVLKAVSYDNMEFRFNYMFNRNILYKYVVVVFIGYMLDTSIFNFVQRRLIARYRLFENTRYRKQIDYAIRIAIRSFTSLLLLNFIKFQWAYIDTNDMYLTGIILSLFSVMVLIVMQTTDDHV